MNIKNNTLEFPSLFKRGLTVKQNTILSFNRKTAWVLLIISVSMKHAKQQGFTLVELIVVITILAILGSIGFISLKSWTADARDSKRKSDIASINKAINLETIKGVSLRAFADGS